MIVPYGRRGRKRKYLQAAGVAGASIAAAAAGRAYERARSGYRWASSKRSRKGSKRLASSYYRGALYQRQAKIGKKVKELQRVAEADMGTHHYKRRLITQTLAAVNAANYCSLSGWTISAVEDALSQLRYLDPGTGALATVAGATGSFQKEFYFKSLWSRCDAHNNYQVPVQITLYCLVPKEDTSITPEDAFTQGLTDVGNPSATSTLIFPSDSPQHRDLWRIQKSKTMMLQPGRCVSLTFKGKKFQYDPSLGDSHADTYQPRFASHTFAVRIQGPVGHDTVASEVSTLQCGVDLVINHRAEIKYAAGADIEFIDISDNMSTAFSNKGCVSAKPVADNQGYSVS